MSGRNFKTLVFGLLLVGCAHADRGIDVRYVDKPIIQQKPCLTRSEIPVRPSRLSPVPEKLDTALALALAKVSEWNRYGNKAGILLDGCSK